MVGTTRTRNKLKRIVVKKVLMHHILNRGSLKNLTRNSKTAFTLLNISRQELRIHSSSLTFATRLATFFLAKHFNQASRSVKFRTLKYDWKKTNKWATALIDKDYIIGSNQFWSATSTRSSQYIFVTSNLDWKFPQFRFEK